MEFSNETLKKMDKDKKKYNKQYASWYYALFQERGGLIVEGYDVEQQRDIIFPLSEVKRYDKENDIESISFEDCREPKYFNSGNRIGSCLDFWQWDKYELNKILDLQKVNRCKNRAFCPNCKMLNTARFIHEFKKQFKQLAADYDFYMLTVTVPSFPLSDDGIELKKGIEKLSKDFNKLYRRFHEPLQKIVYDDPEKTLYHLVDNSQALQCRLVDIAGGIRVLEVTYNEEAGFHPHYHSVILIPKDTINPADLKKKTKGKFSAKRQSYNYKSDIDIQISKAWSMIYYGISFRKWDSVDYDPKEKYLKIDDIETEYKCLECDFVELDKNGIYEVFKYTFKNSEVANYRVFKNLVYALEGKRFRQGFGVLYRFKCDDEFEDGETQPLDLEFDEEPEELITKELSILWEEYREFKKISRFQKGSMADTENIAD